MIIKEDELKKCILFVVEPYLQEYGFILIESSLTIDSKIVLDALLKYQNQTFHIEVTFILDYQNNGFVFKDIEGKVNYSFIELSFLLVFKQFIKIPHLIIKDNLIYYPITLPISQMVLKKHHLIIKIRD